MTVEPLSSNVVNYLVWRYLQEAGYGNAALSLARTWIRDPETLPFAKGVEPHALIHILQDGLWFDKLQADASQGHKKYQFGRDHGTPYSVRNGPNLTVDHGIPAHQLQEGTNGTMPEPIRKGPGGKRKRKVNGVVDSRPDQRTNGDAMDLDQDGAPPTAHSTRAESEAILSEAESATVAELPISTLTIGQSAEMQTEKIADISSGTGFVTIKEPDKTVRHTLWGPPDSEIICTAGKSLLRLHHVPTDLEGHAELLSKDLQLPLNDYTVTAMCWNSHDEATVATQEEQMNEQGEMMQNYKLITLAEGGSDARIVSSLVGMVTTLKWNETAQTLLSISTSDITGTIRVWKGEDSEPAHTATTDGAILDASWMTDTSFVVAGMDFIHIYEIEGGELKCNQPQGFGGTVDSLTWDTVKYDASSGIIACATFEENVLGIVHPSEPTKLHMHRYPDAFFSDLAFQPHLRSAPDSPATPRLLATCSASGLIRLWDADKPFECVRRLNMEVDGPAQRLSFSPDGLLLAAAGHDTATIWKLEHGEFPMAPFAAWNGKDSGGDWDAANGEETEPSLSWDAEGNRLAYGVGNKIAIIKVPR